MKAKELHEELLDIAKKAGITVRKENGSFKSGYCLVKEQKLIIINRTTPPEISNGVIARSIAEADFVDLFLKPVVREFIEKESLSPKSEKDFSLTVNY